jgi:hypothetical protein
MLSKARISHDSRQSELLDHTHAWIEAVPSDKGLVLKL